MGSQHSSVSWISRFYSYQGGSYKGWKNILLQLVKSVNWAEIWANISAMSCQRQVRPAESELMTGIVRYATNLQFMAKKIPQSDLQGKILIWRYGILLIKTGICSPLSPPLSSIIQNFSEKDGWRAVPNANISRSTEPKTQIGICQNVNPAA